MADVRISNMTAAAALTGAEEIPAVQSAANVKTTAQAVRDLAPTSAAAIANGGTGATTAGGARTNLGLVIGTDVQAYNDKLASLAGVAGAADRLPYLSGTSTFALATFTAFARDLLDDTDAAAMRTTLELVKQTSATDTTAGRLLTVGAFGLGGAAYTLTDLTADLASGIYLFNESTATGSPGSQAFLCGLLVNRVPTGHTFMAWRKSGATSTNMKIWFGSRVAVTGAITWVEVKHLSNIVGTVSQSGGTPTGGLIERGSNANGEYVRFADGTQICQTSVASPLYDSDVSGLIAAGANANATWTFPATFVGSSALVKPIISGAVGTITTQVAAAANFTLAASDGNPTTSYVVAVNQAAISRPLNLHAMAIGRWF